MSVKHFLKEQEAGFISLHDVLTRMTQIDGATYQDAAILLYRLLSAEDEDSRPPWHECNALYGNRVASDRRAKAAWECLKQAALAGVPPASSDDEIPLHGRTA